MTTTNKKQDRLGTLISQLSETQNAAAGTKLFANKSDLEAAQARIKVLEQENLALRTRPLAVTPTKAATTPVKASPAPAKVSTSTGAADTYEWKPAPKPVLSREKFAALSPADKSQFVKDGGKISN